MNTSDVTVHIDASEVAEATAEALAEIEELTGAIVIPVAGLPSGSVVTISVTVGAQTPTPAPEPEPASEPARPRYMGMGRR